MLLCLCYSYFLKLIYISRLWSRVWLVLEKCILSFYHTYHIYSVDASSSQMLLQRMWFSDFVPNLFQRILLWRIHTDVCCSASATVPTNDFGGGNGLEGSFNSLILRRGGIVNCLFHTQNRALWGPIDDVGPMVGESRTEYRPVRAPGWCPERQRKYAVATYFFGLPSWPMWQ